MKALLWISSVLLIIVIVQELSWLGKSDLAWVIILLAIAIGLQAAYLIGRRG